MGQRLALGGLGFGLPGKQVLLDEEEPRTLQENEVFEIYGLGNATLTTAGTGARLRFEGVDILYECPGRLSIKARKDVVRDGFCAQERL